MALQAQRQDCAHHDVASRRTPVFLRAAPLQRG